MVAKNRGLLRRMANLARQGVTPADRRAQELLDECHGATAQFWEPDATSYRVLADPYLGDDRQQAWIYGIIPAYPRGSPRP